MNIACLTHYKSSDVDEPSEQAESLVACTLSSGTMSQSTMALTKALATMAHFFSTESYRQLRAIAFEWREVKVFNTGIQSLLPSF